MDSEAISSALLPGPFIPRKKYNVQNHFGSLITECCLLPRLSLAGTGGYQKRTRSTLLIGVGIIFSTMRPFLPEPQRRPPLGWLREPPGHFLKIHTNVLTDTHKSYRRTCPPGVEKSVRSPGFFSDWANTESLPNFDKPPWRIPMWKMGQKEILSVIGWCQELHAVRILFLSHILCTKNTGSINVS